MGWRSVLVLVLVTRIVIGPGLLLSGRVIGGPVLVLFLRMGIVIRPVLVEGGSGPC